MRRLVVVWDRILDVGNGLAACIVLAMTFGVCADVVLRRWGTGGLPWVFDFVEYGLLGITALATAHVLRAGQHVKIDLVVSALRPELQYLFWVFGRFLLLGFSLALTYFAARATYLAYNAGSLLYRYVIIPEWLPYALVTVLFLFVSIEGLRQVIAAVRSRGAVHGERTDMF